MSKSGQIDVVGMSYLDTVPRKAVTVYLPLVVFLIVLLFPFYWMAITAVKPDPELLSREGNPFWVIAPTLAHFHKLLFETAYPQWLWNTVLVSVVSTFGSLVVSVLAAYAIERLRFKGARQTGLAIFLAYLVPPSILFIPLANVVFSLGQRVRHALFGEGTILNFEGAGAHARVQVNFESEGSKWLMLSYAKLESL